MSEIKIMNEEQQLETQKYLEKIRNMSSSDFTLDINAIAKKLGIIKLNAADTSFHSTEEVEKEAIKCHNEWLKKKAADGYVKGEKDDDVAKTLTHMVPWEYLPENIKEMNRQTAITALDTLRDVGIVRVLMSDILPELQLELTRIIHDKWVYNMLQQGYIYGPVRNKDASAGPLTHRDMTSIELIYELYPEDAAYDMDLAKKVLGADDGSYMYFQLDSVA